MNELRLIMFDDSFEGNLNSCFFRTNVSKIKLLRTIKYKDTMKYFYLKLLLLIYKTRFITIINTSDIISIYQFTVSNSVRLEQETKFI